MSWIYSVGSYHEVSVSRGPDPPRKEEKSSAWIHKEGIAVDPKDPLVARRLFLTC